MNIRLRMVLWALWKWGHFERAKPIHIMLIHFEDGCRSFHKFDMESVGQRAIKHAYRILRVCFALSKIPHFHRVYLVTASIQMSIAVRSLNSYKVSAPALAAVITQKMFLQPSDYCIKKTWNVIILSLNLRGAVTIWEWLILACTTVSNDLSDASTLRGKSIHLFAYFSFKRAIFKSSEKSFKANKKDWKNMFFSSNPTWISIKVF